MRKNRNPLFTAVAVMVAGVIGVTAGADAQSPASPLTRPGETVRMPAAPGRAAASLAPGMVAAGVAIVVRQVAAAPLEFPPAATGQLKVAFECGVTLPKPQVDYNHFPRYRCEIDMARTGQLNNLNVARADSFFSADGMTTKAVLVYQKSTPMPAKIRGAFQLFLEQSPGDSQPVLKDFVYADANMAPFPQPVQPTTLR